MAYSTLSILLLAGSVILGGTSLPFLSPNTYHVISSAFVRILSPIAGTPFTPFENPQLTAVSNTSHGASINQYSNRTSTVTAGYPNAPEKQQDGQPPSVRVPPSDSGNPSSAGLRNASSNNGSAPPQPSASISSSTNASSPSQQSQQPASSVTQSSAVSAAAGSGGGGGGSGGGGGPPQNSVPNLSVPVNIVVEASNSSGAVVTFTATAQDPEQGSVPVNCSPSSGSIFPIALTNVTCSATNAQGATARAAFTVMVQVTHPPQIVPPNDVKAISTGQFTNVSLGKPAVTDLVDASPIVTNNAPVTGFPIGSTTVVWTAKDHYGNSAMVKQLVTIFPISGPATHLNVSNSFVMNQQTFVSYSSFFTLDSYSPVGISGTYYRYNYSGSALPAFLNGTSFKISGQDGPYVIQFFSRDAGGTAGQVNNMTVVLDNTAPSTSASITNDTSLSTQSSISLAATDVGGSGVGNAVYSGIYYSFDGNYSSIFCYCTNVNVPLSGLGVGIHNITFYSTDNVGNRESQKLMRFSVIQLPTLTSVSLTASSSSITIGQNEVLSALATDSTGRHMSNIAVSFLWNTSRIGNAITNGTGIATISINESSLGNFTYLASSESIQSNSVTVTVMNKSAVHNNFFLATIVPYVRASDIMYSPYLSSKDIAKLHVPLSHLATSVQLSGLYSLPGTHSMEFFSILDMQNNIQYMRPGDIIWYDFEPGIGYTPAAELVDPLKSVQTASDFAHSHGMKFGLAPTHFLTTQYGAQFAPNCDYYHIQAEAFQQTPGNYSNFVRSTVETLKTASPSIIISTQFGIARGAAPGMTILQTMESEWQSVADVVQGVTLWYGTSRDDTSTVLQFADWFNHNYR